MCPSKAHTLLSCLNIYTCFVHFVNSLQHKQTNYFETAIAQLKQSLCPVIRQRKNYQKLLHERNIHYTNAFQAPVVEDPHQCKTKQSSHRLVNTEDLFTPNRNNLQNISEICDQLFMSSLGHPTLGPGDQQQPWSSHYTLGQVLPV